MEKTLNSFILLTVPHPSIALSSQNPLIGSMNMNMVLWEVFDDTAFHETAISGSLASWLSWSTTPSARERSLMSQDSESSHEQLASNQKQQTDLEVKDDGPDQTKGQLRVAVGDVIVPDVHQFDLRQRNHWDLGSWLVCIERQRQRERVKERQRERQTHVPVFV